MSLSGRNFLRKQSRLTFAKPRRQDGIRPRVAKFLSFWFLSLQTETLSSVATLASRLRLALELRDEPAHRRLWPHREYSHRCPRRPRWLHRLAVHSALRL